MCVKFRSHYEAKKGKWSEVEDEVRAYRLVAATGQHFVQLLNNSGQYAHRRVRMQ